ncbi:MULTISPECIES: hypothetical protein [Mycobacteroides]|uniref:hypothetical protein n=2 Tax=Mycobacteroides TaxID=670516 RepID=UPI0005DC3B82|nr:MULTISPECIES: hypothetical protein [Mycobacteroides]KRQ35682.1 hypothetical protein AOT91_03920 [Mycobacteroides sp. H092]KRQ53464.1 hypothetical protein AOT88_00635 [Mycobacteroides sp. H063]KRQ59874.1 hypothetical protein AOT94_08640 [Mycobacteroides sp. HXVII]KRQ85097.1 hypothetical protein AOT93_03130 [Mycobacteroides sp. H110]AMU26615.1 hypothetical protein A3N96_15460 [Mycobacteroides abscessus]
MMPPDKFQPGQRLTDAEIADLDEPVPAGVVAVWGADWSGNPVLRGVRSGYRSVLVGKFGEGFDGSGPSATLCGECGELLVVQASGELTLLHQRHLDREHGISASLLR